MLVCVFDLYSDVCGGTVIFGHARVLVSRVTEARVTAHQSTQNLPATHHTQLITYHAPRRSSSVPAPGQGIPQKQTNTNPYKPPGEDVAITKPTAMVPAGCTPTAAPLLYTLYPNRLGFGASGIHWGILVVRGACLSAYHIATHSRTVGLVPRRT